MADQMNQPVSSGSNDVEDNKVIALLSYVIFFIPLIANAKNSPFVKYHAKQGIVLFLFGLVLGIVSWVFTIITLGFGVLLAWVLYIPPFVLGVMGIMNAWNGKMVPLPMIGKYADKIKI